jgi:hypothetical protein
MKNRKIVGYRIHHVGGLLDDDEKCDRQHAEQVAKIWRGISGYIPVVAQRDVEIDGELIFENINE